MLSMLSYSESSQTLMGVWTLPLGHPNGQLGIQLLLSCTLSRIFQEFGNFLLDACDTDACHIEAFQ
jgi:hypothetical protein